MRRNLQAALSAAVISSVLIVSMDFHLFRNFFLSAVPSPELTRPRIQPESLTLEESLPQRRRSQLRTDAVMLPDWETLVLLPPGSPAPPVPVSCLFPNGDVSPAVPAGVIPSSGRAALRCSIPNSARRRLLPPSLPGAAPAPEFIRWNRLVYEAISTANDVIVLAKGVNKRQGADRPAGDLRCVFFAGGGTVAVATTPVKSSAQEVFRCPHPEPTALVADGDGEGGGTDLRVSIEIRGEPRPFPSLASYRPLSRDLSSTAAQNKTKSLICTCTMVYNVAKFLAEWVTYHSAIGVNRFILYDNGSDDGLETEVGRLVRESHDISTTYWPWPKTQEAGFSHCAAAHRDSCEWMAFIDVDEFFFSPRWPGSVGPSRTMLRSILPPDPDSVGIGQVSSACLDFSPSGLKEHPARGVTQGYTCRARAHERHKSVVLLRALDESLVNAVHHFWLNQGWRTKRVQAREAVVNHYKFQAWTEFRVKFRRRVSAYVADWRNRANMSSKDRTPGLGSEPVEPKGWEWRFCEVNDTGLAELNRKWFGIDGPAGEYRMAWE